MTADPGSSVSHLQTLAPPSTAAPHPPCAPSPHPSAVLQERGREGSSQKRPRPLAPHACLTHQQLSLQALLVNTWIRKGRAARAGGQGDETFRRGRTVLNHAYDGSSMTVYTCKISPNFISRTLYSINLPTHKVRQGLRLGEFQTGMKRLRGASAPERLVSCPSLTRHPTSSFTSWICEMR